MKIVTRESHQTRYEICCVFLFLLQEILRDVSVTE